jgi:hypothetical protein
MDIDNLKRGQTIYVLGYLDIRPVVVAEVDPHGDCVWWVYTASDLTFMPAHLALAQDVFVDRVEAFREHGKRLRAALRSHENEERFNKRHQFAAV